ncbi:hypothetical protein TeGR_g2847 [Tetraparma gracilis]|uniref:Ribosome recycling factor domain-containing protein n=1 Tax=Tetraparma gracilis TaxID=2962635 RepID=A0ABQ6MJX5_9STRA|nr:hypothetical protein TeGR_g2847 [Tetraparma gracilis]
MTKTIASLQESLTTIRTGRASPKMLDKVRVSYYDAPTPLRDLASITTSNAQQLSVDVFDKSAMKDVERAIIDANLGLTPTNDGKVIRINVPQLTEDRRKQLAKDAKKMGEEAKVGIRNVRRDEVDKVKKATKKKVIGEDEGKRAEAGVDKAMEKAVKEVEAIVKKKDEELSKV